MNKDFILKDKLNIYNNRAKSGESSGRLSVVYNIYPAPSIFWEFETESKAINLPKQHRNGKLITPFECNSFSMSDPSSDKLHLSGGVRMTGSTARAIVGDPTIKGKYFTFFLPNAKFQEVGMSRKNFLVKEITYKKPQKSAEFSESFHEGFVEANIGNGITINLQTPVESVNWLKAYRSVGTYITTWGNLSVEKDLSVVDATDLLYEIGYLLSFANGGYIAPIVVNANQLDFEKEYPIVYSNFLVDPIEHVAGTWLDKQSDISDLLKCFPSFQKMLRADQWKENYSVVLMWYFQAIQPSGIQLGGKPWPVTANAVGAALEKLASIILLDERKTVKAKDFKNMHLEDKIRKLLEAIGITIVGPKYEIKDLKYGGLDAVSWFVKMRNDATHPKSTYKWKPYEMDMILGQAIQWVEETLLWRLGYEGGYSNRLGHGGFFASPRYRIDLRDVSW